MHYENALGEDPTWLWTVLGLVERYLGKYISLCLKMKATDETNYSDMMCNFCLIRLHFFLLLTHYFFFLIRIFVAGKSNIQTIRP